MAWVAERQAGTISAAQLQICGITRSGIRHRLAHGRLHLLYRAVFLVGHAAAPDAARQYGAILAYPPDVLLALASAGASWGMCDDDPSGTVHVTGLVNHGPTPGICFHRTRLLPRADRRSKNGLPLTSPARTLIDLAATMTERELERALDEALIRRLLRERDLRAALDRSRGRAGVGRLRALIGDGLDNGATRSEAERAFRRIVRAAELPSPQYNEPVGRYVIDALWREERLAVELDSYRFHGSRIPFEADRARDADLTGYTVRRFTWRRLSRNPEAVAATVARELALRSGG